MVQKSVWRSSESRVGVTSQMQLWSNFFLFKMDRSCRFEKLESEPKLQFWLHVKLQLCSTFKLLESATLVHFEEQNVEHFSGPKGAIFFWYFICPIAMYKLSYWFHSPKVNFSSQQWMSIYYLEESPKYLLLAYLLWN